MRGRSAWRSRREAFETQGRAATGLRTFFVTPLFYETPPTLLDSRPLFAEAALRCPPAKPRRARARSSGGSLPEVCFVMPWGGLGGAGLLLAAVACGFSASRWRRVFMCHKEMDARYHARLKRAGVEIAPFDPARLSRAALILYWGDGMPNSIVAAGAWPPMIAIVHTAVESARTSLGICARGTVHGIGSNGSAARLIERTMGWADGSVPTIWTYVEPETPIAPRRRAPRAAAREPLVLGFVGRLSFEKNAGTLIAALDRLPPRVSLRLYGEGPQEAALRRLAEPFGERVRFCGRLEDTSQAYEEIDALVIPSLYEGLPVVLVEAFRAGCPVLTLPYGDLGYIAQDRVRGFLIREPTVRGVSEAIESLLSAPDAGARVIAPAQAFAEKHLSESEMAARYELHAEAVLGGLRPPSAWRGAVVARRQRRQHDTRPADWTPSVDE